MLVLEDICKRYTQRDGHEVEALSHATLTVEAGDFVSVQGPSGCGKSTLLLIAGGLLSPDQGQVRVADTDVYTQGQNERAKLRAQHIGFVYQQFHLIPYLSLKDNILSATLAPGRSHAKTQVDALMTQFGIEDRANQLVPTLSIGERQRTALARAMIGEPKLILADEPTGNLDPENGEIVLGAMAEFAEAGGAVLLVTHDPNIGQYATRRVTMNEGVLQES